LLPLKRRGAGGGFREGGGPVFERLRAGNEGRVFSGGPGGGGGLARAGGGGRLPAGGRPPRPAGALGVRAGARARGGRPPRAPPPRGGFVFPRPRGPPPTPRPRGATRGARTAAWLYAGLPGACARPPGLAHLEDPKLTGDLTVARDFALGMTGPPLFIAMDFIASGLIELIGGLVCAAVLAAYAWWAPFLLGGAWLATHWLLRESSGCHHPTT